MPDINENPLERVLLCTKPLNLRFSAQAAPSLTIHCLQDTIFLVRYLLETSSLRIAEIQSKWASYHLGEVQQDTYNLLKVFKASHNFIYPINVSFWHKAAIQSWGTESQL